MRPISAEFLMSEPEQTIANTPGEEVLKNSDQVAGTTPSVGQQLAHRRQQHGWSIDDVANQLKLAPRQIQAIEDDNYAALPTIVMTRGYIRSYAKMLGLDPATILPSSVPAMAVKAQILGRQPTSATIFSESRLLLGGRNRVRYNWIFGAIVLVLIGILMAEFGGFSALHRPTVQSASAAVVPASASAGVTSSALSAASHEVAAVEGALAPALVPLNAAITALKPQAEASATNGVPAAAAGANLLKLTFKQDSWVEIKRADKNILFSRVGKAGSTETFDIDQPVSVVIGNLAGVDVTLRGAAIDLKAGTKNNIARLNLK
ncbi:RodZ domain-containing protein [Glaciimonas sp. PAMC28666]|uniref:RodZ domain-containing protein n=1 Tax=Glaciimonas sp. PAMC28666 TaxID=2807626 RepID=UPI001963716F|nr:RodZ domain-containing protein [Glaciimonas sp. PAMC28666]QRX83003.1 helix-turn-helix domain-containing protein [Glaciimonas sp. PAMC28666]